MAKARFVSKYGNYSVGIQGLKAEHYGTGESTILKRRLDAQFHNRLVTEDDFVIALQSFTFEGLPENLETNSDLSPRFRVSTWDSEWCKENESWSQDEVDLAIEVLRKDPGFGREHVEVSPVLAKSPFPAYDELSVEEILQIVKLTKVDPESVVAYERENANREDLISRLEGKSVDDDIVVVQA